MPLTEPTFVREKLHTIVKDNFGVEDEKIVDDANFMDDLGADSLDIVELVMAAEEEFNVEIPDDIADQMVTFGDAVRLTEGLVNGA